MNFLESVFSFLSDTSSSSDTTSIGSSSDDAPCSANGFGVAASFCDCAADASSMSPSFSVTTECWGSLDTSSSFDTSMFNNEW